ncbi:two-component sensor histidine kinase [Nocardiopsis sp. CNR-923]|uniref:sensor histidine kinase n=1 Tax=Nocardiopsis sp. CNR-923 TaxID=1904965 RepID=UPI000959E495|nr:sensor histidine kinase [Nocardiopsis sp. CNR-923]OLT26023.1 two-component sensor histidine kinase [Nocardiopsis sp. CNR-923]
MALNRASARVSGQLAATDGGLPRLVAWAAGVLLALAWCVDLANTARVLGEEDWVGPPERSLYLLTLVSGSVLVVLGWIALWPGTRASTTTVLGVCGALVATGASAVLWDAPKGVFGYSFASSEALGLLLLLTLMALRGRVWQIGLVSALAFTAFLTDYLREPYWPGQLSGTLVAVGVGLAPGLFLRWRAARHREHVATVRAQERLSLARDLHDVVAHEVTGIVVQVQALRYVAERDPEAVRAALPGIEAAGGRALESMRGLVTRLREPDDAPLAANVAQGLEQLAAPARCGRPQVRVHAGAAVGDLPTDVGTAVLRIAQESVTNALRYARGAERVTVVVEVFDRGVRLRVYDDGRGGAVPVGGGHGLLGMAERARLVGGELTAGPLGPTRGWVVRAWLPLGGDGDEDA